MSVLDITEFSWELIGWRQWEWKLRKAAETGNELRAELGPYPASVPGSVQENLRYSGVVKDWNYGTNSLECEWVENRHWEFRTHVRLFEHQCNAACVLVAESLDYSGWVLVDDDEVATFNGVLLEHRFGLSTFLSDGKSHVLRIVFDVPPQEQGQIGFTSKSMHFKPRFNYGWDWCPRFVPIGIAGELTLKTGFDAEFELGKIVTDLSSDFKKGSLWVGLKVAGHVRQNELQLRLILLDGELEVAKQIQSLAAGESTASLTDMEVMPWMPNLSGESVTYTLRVEVIDSLGDVLFREKRQVGFKRVRWSDCEDSPKDAMPWICEVNGKEIFLQGVNWTPVKLDYANTTPEEYTDLLGKYRDMGCNLLRVWGGAALESEVFYDICDKMGLMVWQEFPLSSSGLENVPPDSDDAIKELNTIARSYVRHRSHHPSLLMWGGGNELTDEKGVPADLNSSQCLKNLSEIVEKEDSQRAFVPTSPSGPRFCADQNDYGKGLHHDVHGPWGFSNLDTNNWDEYWDGDDSLLRSEVGVPGACDVELIQKYIGQNVWPPINPVWRHSCSWWIMWDEYQRLDELVPDDALTEYVRQTQRAQAEALSYAARACKNRFPKCGGFLIWMGHDSFPCPVNNSIIDFDGNCKPAYYELQKVFTSEVSINFKENMPKKDVFEVEV